MLQERIGSLSLLSLAVLAIGFGLSWHLLSGAGSPELDAPPTADEIMRQVDARPRGQDQTASAEWTLIGESGRKQTRKTRFYRIEQPPQSSDLLSKWLIVFDYPPDLKDTALLVWNPRLATSSADQWIYMSAYRRVRRVASRARTTAFMGTDFAFEDISERASDQDEHALLGVEENGGPRQFVIESTPRPGTSGYQKRVQWIDPSNWTITRIDFYGVEDAPRKSLHLRWEEQDGVWIWSRLEMVDHGSASRTIIDVAEAQVDTGLTEESFEPGALKTAGR